MNIKIIADSSALFSLVIKKDRNNKKAKKIIQELGTHNVSIILPGEVFTELVNILGKNIDHQVAFAVGQTILQEETFIIEETTQSVRYSAFLTFQKQPKSVSYTDCLVMAFADEYETKKIFGFDEAFHKNGYKRIGIDK
jgi:predicted nucleic acid-binding protein